MKKTLLFSIIISVFLSVSYAFAEETESYVKNVSVAKELLKVILPEMPFQGESVTRGEFVEVTSRLLKADTQKATDTVYSDVTAEHQYAGGIKNALEAGWISAGDTFRPDDNILFNEALKIIVSAAGYAGNAEFNGGFPAGYYMQAEELDLLDGIKQREDNLLDNEQAMVLMYNFLNARYGDRTYSYGTKPVKFYSNPSGRTILSVYHNIEKAEGIISATSYNSFEYNTPVNVNAKRVTINDINYEYDKVTPDLLGKYAVVFYKEDTGKAIVLNTGFENVTVKYNLEDIEFKDANLVEYKAENGKTKKLKLSGGILTYNGRTVEELNAECFSGDGYAVFIDNDDDEEYEVIQVTAYTYIVVDSVDRLNRKIGDANNDAYSLNLKNCDDELIEVYDENDEELSLYNVEQGDVFEVIAPKDMSFVQMRMLTTQVTGKVESQDEEHLIIDGNEYRYSKYFADNYLEKLAVGTSDSYYIGYNNAVVMCKNSKNEYQYGFIMKIYLSEDGSTPFVKMFTTEGKKNDFEIEQKVTVDGKSVNASVITDKGSQLNDSERLVKYMVNSKGKITKIDFPVTYDYETVETQKSDINNSLIYYSGYSSTLTYRNNLKTFTGKVALSTSKCFMIPEDLNTNIKYFKSGDASSVLKHNVSYKTYVYDVDEEGYAGIVVVRGLDDNISTEVSYVVEKIYDGLDNEGAPVRHITCFGNNQYYTYYMPYDMTVDKDSGDMLEPGDVVRIKTDSQNYIYKVQVDFDYGTFDKISTMTSSNYMNVSSSKAYWMGLAYSVSSSGFVQIASEKNEYGEYDFSQYKLNPMSVRSNIVRFDCETKQLRPINYDEIKTYRAFGDECEYIVLCSDYDISKMAVVYDNHWNR